MLRAHLDLQLKPIGRSSQLLYGPMISNMQQAIVAHVAHNDAISSNFRVWIICRRCDHIPSRSPVPTTSDPSCTTGRVRMITSYFLSCASTITQRQERTTKERRMPLSFYTQGVYASVRQPVDLYYSCRMQMKRIR